MKVVILAGGFGTRISEESYMRPKPMLEIGGHPILWHIMKIYSVYGFNEFVICLGYKGYMIKEYFAEYYLHTSDVTFDFTRDNRMIIHNSVTEPWKVTLVDTGGNAQTGARIKRVQKYIGKETFMLTYGDGVSNVNVIKLLDFHRRSNAVVTMTAVQPGGRYGMLDIDCDTNKVTKFVEKSSKDGGWVNGGFMVCEPEVFDYIADDDDEMFERRPLESLSADGKVQAYKHDDFWQCMDTKRDMDRLEHLWVNNQAEWKIW